MSVKQLMNSLIGFHVIVLKNDGILAALTFNNDPEIKYKVRLNCSRFMIHNEVLNFHD